MKTFNKYNLPEEIKYNGKTYTRDSEKTDAHRDRTHPDLKGCILVKVLSRNLRGREDIHGKPYKGSEHIFSTKTEYKKLKFRAECIADVYSFKNNLPPRTAGKFKVELDEHGPDVVATFQTVLTVTAALMYLAEIENYTGIRQI